MSDKLQKLLILLIYLVYMTFSKQKGIIVETVMPLTKYIFTESGRYTNENAYFRT